MQTEQAKKPGGAERDRTADLLIANEALSQLSYSPKRVLRVSRAEGERYLGSGSVFCQWRRNVSFPIPLPTFTRQRSPALEGQLNDHCAQISAAADPGYLLVGYHRGGHCQLACRFRHHQRV